jgi:glycosyltransferase involved in cell wall biosynthesis
MNKSTIIIVLPCYNEQEILADSNNRLLNLLQQLISDNIISSNSRILYVNDGSIDSTWQIIKQLHDETPLVCGVNLAKNVGQQNALVAGLSVALESGDAVITIDADLQDDINAIPEMINKYQEGNDIVYGVRQERKTDSFFKRQSALFFYKFMDILGVNTVYNHADYRLMSSRAVNELLKYKERNLFLRGIVPLIGYQTANVYYNRDKRIAGKSKYSFIAMLNFAIDGVTSFSIKPVRMVFILGIVSILISLGILIYVLHALISGNAVQGWTSIILSIWFVGGCILIGLGIIGEYIGKIYIEVKNRPRYNIKEIIK